MVDLLQGWTLITAAIVGTGGAATVVWKAFKAGDKFTERTAQRFLDKLDIRQEPTIRKVVSEEIQAKLDNGSELRRTLDAFRLEVAERLGGIEMRIDNVERQLENVITQELPQITALTHKVLGTDDIEGEPI